MLRVGAVTGTQEVGMHKDVECADGEERGAQAMKHGPWGRLGMHGGRMDMNGLS